MTKEQATRITVGTEAWSRETGLGNPYRVTEIRHTGPRPPYFRLRGVLLSYRNVTRNTGVPTYLTETQGPARRIHRKKTERKVAG